MGTSISLSRHTPLTRTLEWTALFVHTKNKVLSRSLSLLDSGWEFICWRKAGSDASIWPCDRAGRRRRRVCRPDLFVTVAVFALRLRCLLKQWGNTRISTYPSAQLGANQASYSGRTVSQYLPLFIQRSAGRSRGSGASRRWGPRSVCVVTPLLSDRVHREGL